MPFFHALAHFARVAFRIVRRLWLFPVALICQDLLLAGCVFAFAGGFWLQRSFDLESLWTLSACVVIGNALGLAYRGRELRSSAALLLKLAIANAVAFAFYYAVRGALVQVVGRGTFGTFLVVFGLLQFVCHRRQRGHGLTAAQILEPLRWVFMITAVLWIHAPIVSTRAMGAGDSYWYSIMIADFVSQWREGLFPVFAGQSEFAFNGAVSPLRFAPYLQHFAGVLDLFTFRSLTFYGLQNLALLTSFLGGAFICYFCLRALEPRTPWIAFALSLLYAACPGLLALAYTGDLFMSVTALPYLPLLVYAVWRTLVRPDLAAVLLMVGCLALFWYCHPPIALWACVVATVTQLLRIGRDGRNRQTWVHWALGAAAFAPLTLYAFYSVGSMDVPLVDHLFRRNLTDVVRLFFVRSFHPVDQAVVEVSNYQLGWSLWAVLLLGLGALAFSRQLRRPAAILLAAFLFLYAFLVPGPWLDTLWNLLPQAFCDITNSWPMQRFYAILATLAVFFAFVVLATLAAGRRGWSFFLGVLLIAGSIWSGLQVHQFHVASVRNSSSVADAAKKHRTENLVLTRYAFSPLRVLPSYYSHGFIDPWLQNRLLAPGTFASQISNATTVESQAGFGRVVAEADVTVDRPNANSPILVLAPDFRIEPGRHYVLTFDFHHPEIVGSLTLVGSSLSRLYWLPDSGYGMTTATPSQALGTMPDRPHGISLWTSEKAGETVQMIFYFSDPATATGFASFGHYTLREYDPAQLPISIESWIPYRARFVSAQPTWLETPRMFLTGYSATVNGQPAEVSRSPDARVMVQVPAGSNQVELRFSGSALLRGAYFLSLASWLALAGLGVTYLRRKPRRTTAATT